MNVFVTLPGTAPTPASGPGDLNPAGEGARVTILGDPADGRVGALWAGPIGLAVMRGASVKKVAA